MIVRFSFVAFIVALLVVGCAECEGIGHANVQETHSAAEPVKELEEVIVEDPIEEPIVEPVAKRVADPSDKPIEEPTVDPVEEPTVDPVEEPTVDPVDEPIEEIETPIEVPVCDRVRPVPRDGYEMVFIPNSNVQYTVCANSQISEDVYMNPDSPLYCPTTCTDGPMAWFPADIDRDAFDEAVCDIETNYANGGLGAKRICERGARLSTRNGKGLLTAHWYGDNTLDWGVCLPSSQGSGRSFPKNNRCKTDCDCAHQLLRGKNNPEYNDYFCHTDGYCYKGTFEEREIYNDVIELPSELPSQA